MKTITYGNCQIHFLNQNFDILNQLVSDKKYSKVFLLTDENTHQFCFPKLVSHLDFEFEILEIDAGETHKNIDTCMGVWEALSELEADRKSLLINLGGGVVTDLGGFVACTFKRGIDYVNIPTSLLSMVDASIGGKTGVDLGLLKNQIGVISNPELVLIDVSFLETLPANQLRSGFAEMLKHGLIQDINYWNQLIAINELYIDDLEQLIYESVIIKKQVVEQDPNEDGLRKTLNFGHTLGHAIESYSLQDKDLKPLLHGEAIAIGMVMASFISSKSLGFPEEDNIDIAKTITSIFGHAPIPEATFEPIIELLKFDKKNSHGNINFVLLEHIGQPKIDCKVNNNLILDAFNFYNSLKTN